MREQNEKQKKLSEFNRALYLVSQIVKSKSEIRKLNKEKENLITDSVKALSLNQEVEKLSQELTALEKQVDSILKRIFEGREELISTVKIDYDDIHVVDTFQDYMQLI